MFADVSGFTKLSEAMTKYGPEGGEHVKKHLNSYFGQMVRIIAGEGGDIFKFAGDAMIVLWPDVDDVQVGARGGCGAARRVRRRPPPPPVPRADAPAPRCECGTRDSADAAQCGYG